MPKFPLDILAPSYRIPYKELLISYLVLYHGQKDPARAPAVDRALDIIELLAVRETALPLSEMLNKTRYSEAVSDQDIKHTV